MIYLVVKALLSGVIIMAVSEIARRSPAFGALVWRDTRDVQRIANHAEATLWYAIPSLPMFLVLPWMLRSGTAFWVALATSCLMTVLLYGLTVLVAAQFGVKL